jgi:hypothetical protein
MVVSLLPPKSEPRRPDDHHFSYPVVSPLPRPPQPAPPRNIW